MSPEVEPSGSKYVEDLNKIRKCAFRWFISYNYITKRGAKNIKLPSPIIQKCPQWGSSYRPSNTPLKSISVSLSGTQCIEVVAELYTAKLMTTKPTGNNGWNIWMG
jgi:hypothetical protein